MQHAKGTNIHPWTRLRTTHKALGVLQYHYYHTINHIELWPLNVLLIHTIYCNISSSTVLIDRLQCYFALNRFQSLLAWQLQAKPSVSVQISNHLTSWFRNNKQSNFTCIQAFWTRVTLLISLATPHFHQLSVKTVQYLSIHRVHRIGQLHKKNK